MLYLGIDQHSKQLTVCVRTPAGQVILRRQVSTRREKIKQFFDQLLSEETDFMAIVEVCGFNDWLLAELKARNCQEIVLIHPEKTSKKKTDRRDANKLCESLWLNGERLAQGERPQGLRRVHIASDQQQGDRQLTALRKRLAQQRTRTLNKIQRILHCRNRMWDYPTKTFQTKGGRQWLATLALPPTDRMEMDLLLAQWQLWDEQLAQVDKEIAERVRPKPASDPSNGTSREIMSSAQLLATVPGISAYSGLGLASRIGPIDRFPRPRSLANYFGLTPGCRNSGKSNHRLGSITKEGSGMARFLLGQAVMHVLKKDKHIQQWYRGIKARRGSKIARVAVMRRLTTILWHMLKHREAYSPGGSPRVLGNLHSGSPKGAKEMGVV